LAVDGRGGLATLKAFVVLGNGASGSEETTRQLQDYVKARPLPRIVAYVSELPKTGSGKIDRQSLLHGARSGDALGRINGDRSTIEHEANPNGQ
jgi:acyl-coenzyme A synthetase/AMP-(fatty) acid ligase